MKTRRYASDNVKYLNQSSIERLLNDDNCYSVSSGEYDETALKERLIELKSDKAEVLASKGYDRMLEQQMIEQQASSELTDHWLVKHLKTIKLDAVKPTVKQPRQWKFILKY